MDVDVAIGKVAEAGDALPIMMIVSCSDDGVVLAIHGEIVDGTGCLTECLIVCPTGFPIVTEIAMGTGTARLSLSTVYWIETASEICASGTGIENEIAILTGETDSTGEKNGRIGVPNGMIGTDHWRPGREGTVLLVGQIIVALLAPPQQLLILYLPWHPLLPLIACLTRYHWTRPAKDRFFQAQLAQKFAAIVNAQSLLFARSPRKIQCPLLNIRLPRRRHKFLHLDLCLLLSRPCQRQKDLPKGGQEVMLRRTRRKTAQMDHPPSQCTPQRVRRRIEGNRLTNQIPIMPKKR